MSGGGVTLTSSILNFICYIKDEIEKGNEDKHAYEIMNFKLKGALDLSIEDCKALKHGKNWEEYDKLVKLSRREGSSS